MSYADEVTFEKSDKNILLSIENPNYYEFYYNVAASHFTWSVSIVVYYANDMSEKQQLYT